MKKTTSQNLSKRLAQYGALTVAIAAVADGNSQENIVYTDIADVVMGSGDFVLLDLNNDAINDFTVEHYYYSSSSGFIYNSLKVQPGVSASVLGYLQGGAFAYPFALDNGTVISSAVASFNSVTANWNSGPDQYMNDRSCYYGGSNWCDSSGVLTDKYLGLRFTITTGPEAGVHYGWARLDVNNDPGTGWVVKDFAYHITPDAPINAGQTTTLGIEDNQLNNVKIVALNKSIALFNLPQQTNYRLFSLTGQSVLDGNIDNNTHVIEANTLATGIYILELKDMDTNAVIRKKVVL